MIKIINNIFLLKKNIYIINFNNIIFLIYELYFIFTQLDIKELCQIFLCH